MSLVSVGITFPVKGFTGFSISPFGLFWGNTRPTWTPLAEVRASGLAEPVGNSAPTSGSARQ